MPTSLTAYQVLCWLAMVCGIVVGWQDCSGLPVKTQPVRPGAGRARKRSSDLKRAPPDAPRFEGACNPIRHLLKRHTLNCLLAGLHKPLREREEG